MIRISLTTHRSKPRAKAVIILNVLLSFLLSLGIILPTAALSREQLEFYTQNGIFFYNPDNTVGIDSQTCVGGSNTNYAGDQVFNQDQMNAINANKFAYQAAAEEYGFPWQILAVIHSIESSLSRKNPSNGDGLYQIIHTEWHDETFTAGKVLDDDEFLATTRIAAKFIAEAKGGNLNLNTADGVKQLFLSYNGTGGGYYKAKAEALGYTETYEGSPYVMNRYDAQRDPVRKENMNPAWPGMWVGTTSSNSHYDPNYEWTGFGAYTKYVALGGSGDDGCFYYTPGGYTIAFGASGMDENEASKLMGVYRDRVYNQDAETLKGTYGLTNNNCSGGIAYNCVSFSRYFVNVYTDQKSNIITEPLGDGIDVASNLASGKYKFSACGPKAYAVFSGTGSGSAGHTGVILGINTETNQVVTGEAACGSGIGGIKVVVYPFTYFVNRYTHFACPTGVDLSVDNGYVYQYPDLLKTPVSIIRKN